MTTFRGWPPTAIDFYRQLEAENTREWWLAHKTTYDTDVRAPFDALSDLVAEEFSPLKVFRPNRDTRFSKDKTPYKTHLDFLFWIGDGPPRAQPACILRLTSTKVLLGAGQMGLSRDALARYRERLDDPVDGAAARAVVERLEAAGATLSDPDRVRVPKPYAADHPSASLLRCDGFHVTMSAPHPSALDTDEAGDFAAWCTERWTAYRPLLDWFAGGALCT